jgi:3-deoxy-manno-octulosonate cytidylyltransferase (CMP-KDO synthetase)
MSLPINPIIVIPARMASNRLPGKPLADIHGDPMIVHVWRRAMEADIGPVVVAAAEQEIVSAVKDAGGRAVLTRVDHASGSDRVFEAMQIVDPHAEHDAVVNVQGDLPSVNPQIIRDAIKPLKEVGVDIGTLVAEIQEESERDNPNVVKAVVSFKPGQRIGRALYFSRTAVPRGEGPLFHHIGLYVYRRHSLSRFVGLPSGVLEEREKLEQLRALENGMRIDAALVDSAPWGVDTAAELDLARRVLSPS